MNNSSGSGRERNNKIVSLNVKITTNNINNEINSHHHHGGGVGNDGSNKDIIEIPKFVLSVLNQIDYEGEYYAYLMTHPIKGKKKDTHIGCSKNPIHTAYLHNTKKIYDKDTRIAPGHWVLSIVLGPFTCEELCSECCKDWVTNTRGITSKVNKGVVLAKKYNVNIYNTQENTNICLKDYLEKYAPAIYIDEYNKLF